MTDQADIGPIREWLAAAETATPGTWYPQPDDLIGGWCVTNVDKPPSQHGGRETGERAVADFTNAPDAAFIAACRNVVPAVAAQAAEVRALRAENERLLDALRKSEAIFIAAGCERADERDSALAELAAARDQIAAVTAETHLDDDLPILAPDGRTDQWVEGWDYAIDEMWRRVRAALSQSGQPTGGA